MKKDTGKIEQEKQQNDLELQRYKDLLSLREKEIKGLQLKCDQQKNIEENYKKQINNLEKENKDLSTSLIKS